MLLLLPVYPVPNSDFSVTLAFSLQHFLLYFSSLPQIVFPDSEHPPALAAQGPADQAIAAFVGRQLALPESAMAGRDSGMFGAAMPETAIHEHRHPPLGENEIRPPKNRLMPPPPGDAMAPKEPHQGQFRVLVPARPDARHHLRPLRLGENVRHKLTTDKTGCTRIKAAGII